MCTILKLAVLAVLALAVAVFVLVNARVDVSIPPTPTPTVQARFRDRPRRVRQARIDQELESWEKLCASHAIARFDRIRRRNPILAESLMDIQIPDANPIDCPQCTK